MSTPAPKKANNIDFDALEAIGKKGSEKRSGSSTKSKSIATPDSSVELKPEAEAKQAKITEGLAKLNERTAQALQRQRSVLDARVLQQVFPFWDDENRGVPNPFIRSGLFSVKNTEKREFLQGLKIASSSLYDISYTGNELQQDDLSVWISLINLARNQPMSDQVLFSGYQLIKDLGWRMHSDSYRRAQESIQRLKVTGLEITSKNKEQGYSGSLIRDFGWAEMDEKGNARWMVRFESRISTLFLDDTTTLMEWETRKKIGTRATLAQWLHSFYSSHKEPIPIGIAKLHEMCRSGDTLSSFRRNIKNALEKLVTVEFLAGYTIQNDNVHVQKRVRVKLIRAK